MKTKFLFLACLMVLVGVFTFAFKSSDQVDANIVEIIADQGVTLDEAEDIAGRNWYYATTSDTITDAENDTIVTNFGFYTQWTYNITLEATQLSGTTSIIAILQEQNPYNTAENDWYEVERDTISATGIIRLYGGSNDLANVKGRRQRVILDGGGTQSSTYTLDTNYKRRQ
jgi:hypothetical protein